MFNLFLAVSPEIFIINATFILLIHGVVFSTSKKYDYPPLVSNVGWLGLLSVARLGGQRALGCGGAIIAQLPNLMRHRVRTAGNRSMGGRLILLPPQGWLIGLVPMEIPLGLIPRLMTKGESAWRKVKIGGSRAKFPSGGPERLGHRNLDHLRAGKRKPPRPDQSKQQCRIRPPLALKEFTRGHQLSQNKGRSAAYCSRKHPTYTIVKSYADLSDLLSHKIFGFDRFKRLGLRPWRLNPPTVAKVEKAAPKAAVHLVVYYANQPVDPPASEAREAETEA
ncbi:hypothetical protein RHSIM_RhsimMtG0002900 (mitochondrion) [Rhododendron simsii]|uniref:NADH dehydrogenase subunit 2 n=1 Tax=Rhododendron simsii TaxID=118357 RepID=A0A834FWN3_RHOSS|nr:hypothetical protein RHSIM_RhsimMtG0002900 [Rhododendron simsii]